MYAFQNQKKNENTQRACRNFSYSVFFPRFIVWNVRVHSNDDERATIFDRFCESHWADECRDECFELNCCNRNVRGSYYLSNRLVIMIPMSLSSLSLLWSTRSCRYKRRIRLCVRVCVCEMCAKARESIWMYVVIWMWKCKTFFVPVRRTVNWILKHERCGGKIIQ